jgi:hypothetical protein
MSVQKVLIVDDSKSARVMLGRILTQEGVDSWCCESAELALLALQTQPLPDVIFMDHLMPGINGLQAVEQLKADAHTALVPVVMYTTRDEPGYWQQAIDVGAFDVVHKPVKPQAVVDIVARLNHFLLSAKITNSATTLDVEGFGAQQVETMQPLTLPLLTHQQDELLARQFADIEARLDDLDGFLLKQQQRFLFKDELHEVLLKIRQHTFEDLDKRLRPLINAVHQDNMLLEMKGDAFDQWLSRLQQQMKSPQLDSITDGLQALEQRLQTLTAQYQDLAEKSVSPVRPSLMRLACWVLLFTACSLLYHTLNL